MLLHKSILHLIPFPRGELEKVEQKATRMTKDEHFVHEVIPTVKPRFLVGI